MVEPTSTALEILNEEIKDNEEINDNGEISDNEHSFENKFPSNCPSIASSVLVSELQN
jgi:hypothetical protein